MPSGTRPRDRLLSIHYLRAIAAIMVVLYHVFSHAMVPVPPSAAWVWLKQGVGIFFVISGYIMVVTTASQRLTVGDFLRRRIERIVPLYWFATLLYFAAGPQFDTVHLVRSLLFLPPTDPADITYTPLLSVGWTLNLEMFFYLLFGLALTLPRRIAIWSLCALLATLATVPGLRAVPMVHNYATPIVLDFIAGVAIAHLGIRAPGWALPLGFAGLFVLPLVVDARIVAVTLPAALIVAAARSFDGRLRPWQPAMLLGDASYAIYLFHLLVLNGIFLAVGPRDTMAWALPFAFAAIAAGVAAHVAIERPLGDAVGRLGRRTPAMAVVGS